MNENMFMCPVCRGPHFNVTVSGRLVCASVSALTDYQVKVGGCGWTGFVDNATGVSG